MRNSLDRIALIITITVAIILLTVTISPMITGRPLTQEKAELLAELVGAFIVILGMFVGARLKDRY